MQDFKWCPLYLEKAKPTRIWASQELNLFPPSKHVKHVAHISFYRKHYPHLVDLHSSVDHFEPSASLLSGSWLLYWLLNVSGDKWAELEHHQGRFTKQNKFLQDFPPCCFERYSLHSLCHLSFMKHLALKMRKNEADWTQKQCPGRQKEIGTSWNGNLFISCHLWVTDISWLPCQNQRTCIWFLLKDICKLLILNISKISCSNMSPTGI